MGKTKSIILINTKQNFDDHFLLECKKNKIKCQKIYTDESIIEISTGKVSFINNNSKITLENSYVHIGIDLKRTSLADRHITSIISTYCHDKKIGFTDPINISHSGASGKMTQMIKLANANINIPKSTIFNPRAYNKNKEYILKSLVFPCVLKVNGNKGKGVTKVTSKTQLEKIIKSTADTTVIKIQKFIPNEYDIRVLIFKDSIIGAVKRTSINGFHNNVSKGGNAEPITLSSSEKKLSKKVSKLAGIDFAGVDIVRHDGKSIILEINKFPVYNGFEKATNINVPKKVAEILFNRP